MNCVSPAKLNLFLRIENKRSDGYHDLQSVFHLIGLYDTICFEKSKRFEFSVESTRYPVTTDDSNLIVRSARLLADYATVPCHASIQLKKHIPIGAGLGGGSSNAAVTLMALNRLWKLDLPVTTLIQLGNRLGADVPFFLNGKNAFIQGKGDSYSSIEIEPRWYLLCLSNIMCHTKEVFHAYSRLKQLTKQNDRVALPAFDQVNKVQPEAVVSYGNDLMLSAFSRYPKLLKIYQSIYQYQPLYMTGSGSCFFCVKQTEQQALSLQDELSKKYSRLGCYFEVVQGLRKYDYCE